MLKMMTTAEESLVGKWNEI